MIEALELVCCAVVALQLLVLALLSVRFGPMVWRARRQRRRLGGFVEVGGIPMRRD